MTVLLQQGGQLKDMFGGVGNAAKALGGYVVGLVSPLTVAAGAATALGFAFFEGSKDAETLSKSLIVTGNAAGTSVNKLKDIAAAISNTTGATVGAASEAIQQVVMTGQVAEKNIGMVASAALAMKSATGQTIEDTAKQFAELGKEPVKASLKLTEQYNYLTAEVYKQIKALEDQGRMTDAAALAQSAYASAAEDMKQRVDASLSDLSKNWNAIAASAKSAWDAMLGIGREDSLEQKLAKARKDLANGGGMFGGESEARAKVAVLEAQLDVQNKQKHAQEESNAQEKARIAWMVEGDKYLSKRQQMEQEIAKTRNMGLAAGMSELEIQKRISDVREKYKEKAPADPMRSRDHNEAVAELKRQADTELEAIKKRNAELRASAEAYQYLQDIQSKYARSNADKMESMAVLPESVVRLNRELRNIDQTADTAREKLAKMFGDGKLTEEDYAQRLSELNDITNTQTEAVRALNERQDQLNGSWEYGASKAMQKYQDEAKNVAMQTEGLFDTAFRGMEDAMVKFAQTGKLSFKDMANSVIAEIMRMQAKAATSGIMNMFKGFFTTPTTPSTGNTTPGFSSSDLGSGITLNALGGVYDSPSLSALSSSIVDKPTFFAINKPSVTPFAKGGALGVAGEAGAEAIMPLKRDSSGRLGVTAEKGSSGDVTVIVNNNSSSQASTNERSDGKGGRIIEVLIEQVGNKLASDVSNGNGALPAAIEKTYGVGRRAGAY